MKVPFLLAILLAAAPAFAELPDLGGRSVTVVTENTYPPLQFLDKEGVASAGTMTR